MDKKKTTKKKTTKKNYCYYIVLRYNCTKNGEIGYKMTRVTADELPTLGELETAAEKFCAVRHSDTSYIKGSAIMTFFQKITQKQAKRIYDRSVSKDTKINIID